MIKETTQAAQQERPENGTTILYWRGKDCICVMQASHFKVSDELITCMNESGRSQREFSRHWRGQSPRPSCRGRSRWRPTGTSIPTRRAPPRPCPPCTPQAPTASSSFLLLPFFLSLSAATDAKDAIPQTPSLQPLVFTAPPKEIHQARTTYLPTKHPRSPLQLVPFNQSWNLEHNEQVEEGNWECAPFLVLPDRYIYLQEQRAQAWHLTCRFPLPPRQGKPRGCVSSAQHRV